MVLGAMQMFHSFKAQMQNSLQLDENEKFDKYAKEESNALQ